LNGSNKLLVVTNINIVTIYFCKVPISGSLIIFFSSVR
jgi:hypothetical protein